MERREPGPAGEPTWTREDTALLYTCRAVSELVAGKLISASTPTPFALVGATRAHFVGPVSVLEFRAAGDGSYLRSSGFVFGTGPLGLALLAGSLMGNAAGNARRRREAEQDAQQAFRHEFDAALYVTDGGFTLHNVEGVFHWPNDQIDAMEMLGPHAALMQGRSARGFLTWQLLSPWSELVFAKWALERHRQHHQLVDGSWLHPGWLSYARSHGKDPWLASTQIREGAMRSVIPGTERQDRIIGRGHDGEGL